MIRGRAGVGGRIVRVESPKRMEYLPGQLIVRIKPRAAASPAMAAGLGFRSRDARLTPEAVSAPLEYLRRNAGLKSVTPIFSTRQAQLERAPVSTTERLRLAVLSSVADSASEQLEGINVLRVDAKRVTPSLMRHLQASEAMDIVEPMPARWLQAAAKADPLQNRQWGLRAIRWFEARAGDAGDVKVAVLDTGIDEKHPDLRGTVAEYRHQGLSARDILGHGTHVAGIIAATVNNDEGISGVARCTMAVWKIFEDRPVSDGEFYVDGERYLQALGAVRGAGALVVNLSIGGTASSRTERLIFRALESQGIVVVAAMGNEYGEGNPKEYPAGYPGVLAVGAIAESMRRASFSNTGSHIGLVAPGANILSTLPTRASRYLTETDYASWSGTSMATPHVAGAAALLFGRHPDWTAERVKARLTATARALPAMRRKKRTPAYGAGLLDLPMALR